jgi:MYXO-CTERM domain-containing protein
MSFKYFGAAILASGFVFTAASDANAACGSGLSCEVCNVSGFTPTTMAAPIGPTSGDCTDQDISDFDTACLAASATQSTCSTWESSASKSCLGCLLTQDTATQWGALVCNTSGCNFNVQGCVDLALGTVSQEKQAGGSGSCGDAINASYGCQEYACGTCSTTNSDFTNCANSAVTNECASYVAPVESTTGVCANLQSNTQAMACFVQDEQSEVALATYMCGGGIAPPPDAGPPPNDGGTSSDGGTKNDGGSKADAGKSGDAGSDAGGTFGGKGGCHCDAAGGGGDSLAFAGVIAAFAATLVRRKRKRS